MNGARYQFLARPRLARDEHGHIRRANLVNLFDEPRHRGARMYEAGHEARTCERVRLLCALPAMRARAQSADVHA